MLTLVLLNPDIPCLGKQCRSRSVGLKATDLDLHCYPEWEFISTIWIKQSDWLTIRSGCGILIYSAGQGLIHCIIPTNSVRLHVTKTHFYLTQNRIKICTCFKEFLHIGLQFIHIISRQCYVSLSSDYKITVHIKSCSHHHSINAYTFSIPT